ncbi:MAG: protein-methionine-sulfoxide reductase catalytic subunit MsrP [Nitrospirae bacterium]|nr:protein-methionine-sulfoxide reductase catalytic subunit MsrP [Nitrospirota bacterium]
MLIRIPKGWEIPDAARYNNFYEFSSDKDDVYLKVEKFSVRPWTIEISGLVEKPITFDPDDLLRLMPMEERLYRHRCVEAWAMAVPWTGFPMKAFIDTVRPLSKARFIRFTTFHPARRSNPFTWNAPWPYTEGLTMEEAVNPLTMLVTGIYGHPLPKQHGAPLRLVVPWKYGYKSIKSIVRIEFTEQRPRTFWNTVIPEEYDFPANVNPEVPHPRWSQATEKMIGTGERRPTLLYNGYEKYVAHLYA